MKYLVSWTPRLGGSAADNESSAKRGLQVFSKWSPRSDQTFKEFLTRLDGEGGFAVIETENPAGLLDGPAKFAPFFEFSVYPVIDVTEGVAFANEAIEFRDSVS
jgi:Protein of unknown function (DUF3303)